MIAKECLIVRDLGNGKVEGPVRVTRKAFESIYAEKGFVLATRKNTAEVSPDRASRSKDRNARISQFGGRAPEGGAPDIDGDGVANGVHDQDGNFDLGDDDGSFDDFDDNADSDAGGRELGGTPSAADVARRLGLGDDQAGDKAPKAAAKAAKPKPAGGRSERASG